MKAEFNITVCQWATLPLWTLRGGEHRGQLPLHFARWGGCAPTFIYYYYSKLIINSKK